MLKTELWVKAHLRRCFGAGLTAVVAHKGAREAGSVYIQVTMNTDQVIIFAPAPGPTYDEEGKRNWVKPLGQEPVSPEKANEYIKRQLSFDRDIWIIDIDDRSGTGLL